MCVYVCLCVCVHTHAQSCPTLCGPVDYSPPGFSVHGIVRILDGVAFSSSRDLPDTWIKAMSFVSLALAGNSSSAVPTGKPLTGNEKSKNRCDRFTTISKWVATTMQVKRKRNVF